MPVLKHEVRLLKAIIWHYVIKNPDLVSKEYGQTKVIEFRYTTFLTEANENRLEVFPFQYLQKEYPSAAQAQENCAIASVRHSRHFEADIVQLDERGAVVNIVMIIQLQLGQEGSRGNGNVYMEPAWVSSRTQDPAASERGSLLIAALERVMTGQLHHRIKAEV